MQTTADKWEIFIDDSYYHLWAVRRIGDKSFSSPALFHLSQEEDAKALKELLEKAQ